MTDTDMNQINSKTQVKDLAWEKGDGLLPAIVQDLESGRVLMLGYVNSESMEETLASGYVTFFSRSRQQIWRKGETSGNYLRWVKWEADCDQDTVLFLVNPQGPTCHRGTRSCFDSSTHSNSDADLNSNSGFISDSGVDFESFNQRGIIVTLEALLSERLKSGSPDSSYTARLVQSGIRRVAQKVGEEGVETALAAVGGNEKELANEAADLVYHLLVLLLARGMKWSSVLEVLTKRHHQSRQKNQK